MAGRPMYQAKTITALRSARIITSVILLDTERDVKGGWLGGVVTF